MREQLYSLLKPANRDPVSMNIIGNNYPTDKSADFVQMLNRAGWQVRDICAAANYDEYQKMENPLMPPSSLGIDDQNAPICPYALLWEYLKSRG